MGRKEDSRNFKQRKQFEQQMELVMEPSNEILEQIVKERVHKLKQFYTHLFIYAIGVAVYVAKTYFGAPLNFWPIRFINEFVMGVWTFFLVMQAMQLFVTQKVFGSQWEQKRIQKIMEKEKIKQQKWE
jgi:uncharacterized protein YacL